ncbi:MAG: LysE family translocator [Desulfovibrionaceae bacterium]
MIDYITTGAVLGLSAGLAPGPLLALVISETLQRGVKAGVGVALSPIVTDFPIILLTLLLLAQLSGLHDVLGIISLLGGAVILHMGIDSLRPNPTECVGSGTGRRSLMKGVLANACNPHPYLFWLSVGGPIMSKALSQGIAALAAFIGCFYLSLIGAKVLLAILVGRSRNFLTSALYTYILRFLGLALCVLAFFLFREGFYLLGIMHRG